MEVSQKTKNRSTIRSCSLTPGRISRENHFSKDTYTPVFTVALFTIARTCQHPICLSTEEWIKKMWGIYAQWNITEP